MKNLITIIAMLVLPFVTQAQIKEVKLQASGLTCSMCSNSIHKALEKLSFVKNVKSNVETSVFTIDFKDKANVDIAAMQKAVKKAGFSVADFVMTVKFKSVAVQNKSNLNIADDKFYLIDTKSKILDGLVDLRVLNKDFMSKKDFKKVEKKISDAANTFSVTLS